MFYLYDCVIINEIKHIIKKIIFFTNDYKYQLQNKKKEYIQYRQYINCMFKIKSQFHDLMFRYIHY